MSGAGVTDAWRTTSQRASAEVVERHLVSFDEFVVTALAVRRGWADQCGRRPLCAHAIVWLRAPRRSDCTPDSPRWSEPATALAHLVRAAGEARRDPALGAVCVFHLHRARRMRGELDAAIDALHRAKASP